MHLKGSYLYNNAPALVQNYLTLIKFVLGEVPEREKNSNFITTSKVDIFGTYTFHNRDCDKKKMVVWNKWIQSNE